MLYYFAAMALSKVYDIIFFVLLALVILFMFNPKYNGLDEISYMGIMLEYEYSDMNVIHDKVYSELKRVCDTEVFNKYTDPNNWRSGRYYDVTVFQDKMNYHRAKPLYTWVSYGFYKLGFSLSLATVLPSIISMWFMLLVLYLWLRRYVTRNIGYIIVAVLLVLPVFSYMINMAIPDGMANLFVFLSFYLISKSAKKVWVFICLLLALLSRVDNAIIAIVITFFILDGGWTKRVSQWSAISLIFLVVAATLPILLGNNSNWLLKFDFTKSSGNYMSHVGVLFQYYIRHAWFVFHVMSAILLYIYVDNSSRFHLRILGISFLLHVIFFPSVEERFFLAYEYVIIVMMFKFLYASYSNNENYLKKKIVQADEVAI